MAFQKLTKSNAESGLNELNILNAGTYLEGTLETKGSVQVNGKLKGVIKAGDEVRIGRTVEVIGEIYAKNARVAGTDMSGKKGVAFGGNRIENADNSKTDQPKIKNQK